MRERRRVVKASCFQTIDWQLARQPKSTIDISENSQYLSLTDFKSAISRRLDAFLARVPLGRARIAHDKHQPVSTPESGLA